MRSIIKIILAGALAALMLTLPARALPADSPDPAELLAEGLLSCHESIDLSACGLPASELGRIYADLLHSRPELFHVAPRLSFTLNSCRHTISGLCLEIYPKTESTHSSKFTIS